MDVYIHVCHICHVFFHLRDAIPYSQESRAGDSAAEGRGGDKEVTRGRTQEDGSD